MRVAQGLNTDSGNHFRLIAALGYNTRRAYIRHILTHAEADRGEWKK
ncbi:MAG: hypothetical protein DYG89_21380 [Caldilinea sp. CFX5]|nr:hypothetical protein [Caldilinea sp. CFX5]